MKNFYFIIIICTLSACSVQNTAKKQAVIMVDAITTNNYETTLKYTHASVIKMVGGNNAFVQVLKSGTDEMKLMGNKYESIEIGQPLKTVLAGDEIHCLIPETINMQLKDGKMKHKSYLLAVSKDSGKNWTFIETALITDENIYHLLPNFNKELVIPTKEVPKYFK